MLPLRFLVSKLPPARALRRSLWRCGLIAACPLAAHALQPVAGEEAALEVRSEVVAASPEATPLAFSTPGLQSTTALRSTVWARRGTAAVGLGVQAQQAPGAASPSALAPTSGLDRAALAPAHLFVGMALETSERSRLVVDTPLLPAPRPDDSLNPASGRREVRVGLQIKPADPLKSLRAGQLFKLELSTRSQLSLKPRSGGLMMSYSAKF
jgi:hypothetical protein